MQRQRKTKKPGSMLQVKKMTMEELLAKKLELEDYMVRMEKLKISNGGLGLMPGQYTILALRKVHLIKVDNQIKELTNAGN